MDNFQSAGAKQAATKINSTGIKSRPDIQLLPAHEREESSIPAPPRRPDPGLRLRAIEKILEQDIDFIYAQLEPAIRQKLKTQGESTAKKIARQRQPRALKTFKLITRWLAVIPQANKFFIRQEAKIKTTKIIALTQ